jgi:hypothetical protein
MEEQSRFGYQCDDCGGTVRAIHLEKEIFRRRNDFVVLHGVTIGICSKCSCKYYRADTIKSIHETAIPPPSAAIAV